MLAAFVKIILDSGLLDYIKFMAETWKVAWEFLQPAWVRLLKNTDKDKKAIEAKESIFNFMDTMMGHINQKGFGQDFAKDPQQFPPQGMGIPAFRF